MVPARLLCFPNLEDRLALVGAFNYSFLSCNNIPTIVNHGFLFDFKDILLLPSDAFPWSILSLLLSWLSSCGADGHHDIQVHTWPS